MDSPFSPTRVSARIRRWLSGKESVCNAGDLGLIPGLGRSPGERKGDPLENLHSSILASRIYGLYSPRSHKKLDTTE